MRFKEKKSWVESWVKDSQSQIVKKEKTSSRPVQAIKPKDEILEIKREQGNPWAFFFGFCQPQNFSCTK
jgi:hypothetical protein